jgi:hypothetical protein
MHFIVFLPGIFCIAVFGFKAAGMYLLDHVRNLSMVAAAVADNILRIPATFP